MSISAPASIDATLKLLDEQHYVAGRSFATTLFLALKMQRPLFLEGEAGVGKTEIAKVLANALGRKLLRLQCYEGLDIAAAAYEWDYARQMIAIRSAEASGQAEQQGSTALAADVFSSDFLIQRPLLQALQPFAEGPPVLLIDELDRADEPFEAFLLELLSEFQFTIPEIGTIRAEQAPIVIITSNRTREVHDALKRRCLYHWVDYPDADHELAIVKAKLPELQRDLAAQVVAFVQELRKADLFKLPGVAETLDWGEALQQLQVNELHADTVLDSLGALLKYQDDLAQLDSERVANLLAASRD